jgi:NADH:ubiquinone oxidoreductase subunit F (NADH-binding)/(2Fe-2S) ferredoxin/Pyruvate/2-oxoacid:ferredoxin oxidoreductase delta subunit
MHKDYTSLRAWAEAEHSQKRPADRTQILIGLGTCGIAAGGLDVLNALRQKLSALSITADIVPVGCIGMCFEEPLVDIVKPGAPRISYSRVTPKSVQEIVDDHLVHGNVRKDLAYAVIGDQPLDGIPAWRELPFFAPQLRNVLRNCGFIDPESVAEYIQRDGYAALAKALFEMTPDGVIDEVKRSGLRGRGGAGFPAGMKWGFCRQSPGDHKYIICNADEGDPGAFMNRSVLEGDPHSVLEGLIIAAYAIGADHGYIYCRAEYPLAIVRLRKALEQAHELGLLGEHIMGTDFSFDVTIKEGAGAFVCGEETALMASIEGKRGMPRPRPPFPAQSGLWGKPTNINNAETLNNIPLIVLKGADWYASVGTEKSKGTKTFALTGKVVNSSLVEVPFGLTLRKVIFDVGGGIPNGKKFKAAQTGGPSGGCLSSEHLDWPIDYESLAKAGSIMGSGGLVVMDESTCMVDVARFFLNFTQSESCGKCIPCRLGTKRMLEILERIVAGKGEMSDIDLLLDLGETVKLGSLCGLGQTAPNPVVSTIRYFRDEYEAHIKDHRCPAKVCKALITYTISEENCTGCTLCARSCPVGAITGERKQTHVIDPALCTRCDTCRQVCKFDAVVVE